MVVVVVVAVAVAVAVVVVVVVVAAAAVVVVVAVAVVVVVVVVVVVCAGVCTGAGAMFIVLLPSLLVLSTSDGLDVCTDVCVCARVHTRLCFES